MPAEPTSCTSCGARVDAAPGERAFVTTCRFCGARVTVAPLVQPPDPRAEAARRAEALRIEQAAAAAAVAAAKRASRGAGCFVRVMSLLPIVIVVGVVFGPALRKQVKARLGALPVDLGVNPFPVDVGVNQSLELADRDVTLDGTLVTVGVNGKLTIRNCHLKGAQIVKAGANAEITIVDSTLEGSRGIVEGGPNLVLDVANSTVTSGDTIAEASLGAKVTIERGSRLKAAAIALPLENGATVTIDHSEVDGELGGVELRTNGALKMLAGATVKSDGPAVDLGLNGRLTVSTSWIESKTTALRAMANLEGTLHGAAIIGPREALDLGVNARLTVAQSSVEGPRKLGPGSTVDAR